MKSMVLRTATSRISRVAMGCCKCSREAVLIGDSFCNGLTSPHRQRTEFDAAMSSLGYFGHSVTEVDLSGFMT